MDLTLSGRFHTDLRIGFAGTPSFAATQLLMLRQADVPIQVVLTQPDRLAGRGMKARESAVKTVAMAHQIQVLQPVSLKKGDEARQSIDQLKQLNLDILIVAAYGLILPLEVLQIPRLGCVNVHASLLPRWRGAAPIARAIEAGDVSTGICLMQMDEGLDTGDVLLSEHTDILANDTAASLEERLAQMGGKALLTFLENPSRFQPTAQPDQGVTYAHKLLKDESQIDWSLSAGQLRNKIHALNPAIGVSFSISREDGSVESFKVWLAQVVKVPGTIDVATARCGQVIAAEPKQGLWIACADTPRSGCVLSVLEIQKAGGKRVAIADALRGGLLRGIVGDFA